MQLARLTFKYLIVYCINHSIGLCSVDAKSISLAKSNCKRNAFSLSNFEQTEDSTD